MKKILSLFFLFSSVSLAGGLVGYGKPNKNIPSTSTITGYTNYTVVSDASSATTRAATLEAEAACAALPERGTVLHYCKCDTGADAGCIAGNDTTGDGSASNPYKTLKFPYYSAATTYNTGDGVTQSSWEPYDYRSLVDNNVGHPLSDTNYWAYMNAASHGVSVATRFSSLTGTNTIALCKGGAWLHTSALGSGMWLTNANCTVGTTCTDIREYASPNFTSSAKPIVSTNAIGSRLFLLHITGGIRILNLDLVGNNGALADQTWGIFADASAHDVEICGNNIRNFDSGTVVQGTVGVINKINFTGNSFINNRRFAYFGGANNSKLSQNYFENNGSSDVSLLDHAVYIDYTGVNFDFSQNYIYGHYGASCTGGVAMGHPSIDGFTVKNNYVETTNTSSTCWGMAFNNITNQPEPIYMRNTVISGNTVINGGNLGFSITSCPGCIIENNIIRFTTGESTGIRFNYLPARTGNTDDVGNNVTVRNNVVYFGSGTSGVNTGIMISAEGTGHKLYNNVVYSEQSSGTLVCYSDGNGATSVLPLTSFKSDNNNCYSSGAYYFGAVRNSTTTNYNLTNWRILTGYDANSVTVDPLFTSSSTGDFSLQSNSPLKNIGSRSYFAPNKFDGSSSGYYKNIGAY